jgi:hypothetical protein
MSFKEPSRILQFAFIFEMNVVTRPYYRRYVKELGLRGNERVLEYGQGPEQHHGTSLSGCFHVAVISRASTYRRCG